MYIVEHLNKYNRKRGSKQRVEMTPNKASTHAIEKFKCNFPLEGKKIIQWSGKVYTNIRILFVAVVVLVVQDSLLKFKLLRYYCHFLFLGTN